MSVKTPTAATTTANPFDSYAAIIAAIVTSFVGNGVFIGMPVIVGAAAESFQLKEQQLGWLASAETGGLMVAALITSAILPKVNRKWLVVAGMSLASLANLISAWIVDYEVLLCARVVSGFGGGVCYSLGVACLASTSNTGRNFSILIFGLVLMNVMELYTFPKIAALHGVAGVYTTLAMIFGLSLIVVKWIPAWAATTDPDQNKSQNKVTVVHPRLLICCLLAVFFFYISISSFWTYVERAGVDAGFTDEFISNTLIMGTLLSLVGCLVAGIIAMKWGQLRPLLLSLLLMTVVLAALAGGFSAPGYIVGLVSFNLLWNFVDIFQLGTVSNIDPSGRFTALVPAAQHLANFVGPSLAGFMFVLSYDFPGVMILGAGGSALGLCLYCYVYLNVRKFESH